MSPAYVNAAGTDNQAGATSVVIPSFTRTIGDMVFVFGMAKFGCGNPPVLSVTDTGGVVFSRLQTDPNSQLDVWSGVALSTGSGNITVTFNAPVVESLAVAVSYSGVGSIGQVVTRTDGRQSQMSFTLTLSAGALLLGIFGAYDPSGVGILISAGPNGFLRANGPSTTHCAYGLIENTTGVIVALEQAGIQAPQIEPAVVIELLQTGSGGSGGPTIANLSDVHQIMSTPVTDISADTEFAYLLNAAECELDSWLKAYGSSIKNLPSPTPKDLIMAEAALTAWLFHTVRESPVAIQKFLGTAKRLFNRYAEGNLMYPKVPSETPEETQ